MKSEFKIFALAWIAILLLFPATSQAQTSQDQLDVPTIMIVPEAPQTANMVKYGDVPD